MDLAEEFMERRTPLQRVQGILHKYPYLSPLIVLLVCVVVFYLLNDRFLLPQNLSFVTQQTVVVGTLAIAQTLIILTAGIDLSIGAMMTLAQMTMANLAVYATASNVLPFAGQNPFIAIALGILTGVACGALNGLLIVRLNLPPFIVTLGTWQVFNATKYLYSKNETIRGQDIEAQAPLLQLFGIQIKFGGAVITLGVIFMVLLVVFLWYILNYTAWGRRLYAVGDDPEAAQLTGIRVDRMLIAVYTLSGLICGFAGWVLIGRIGSVVWADQRLKILKGKILIME